MHATARPFATARLALLVSSVSIAVTQAVVPPPRSRHGRAPGGPCSLLTDDRALGILDPSLTSVASLVIFGNLGSLLDLGGLNLDGIQNIPYNLFADVVNIPYEESLALQEYAYALGPADSIGGVPGWIPPGATAADGGVVNDLYALGGTGSWYMESLGNTWGWDDGNWPQLAAISQFLLPFQFTEPIAAQLEGVAQAELIDGAGIGCEFECANPLGYLGGWLHGDTPLTSLLSGTTLPTELEDSVGGTGTTNLLYLFDTLISRNAGGIPPSGDTFWSGSTEQLNLGTFSARSPATSRPVRLRTRSSSPTSRASSQTL